MSIPLHAFLLPLPLFTSPFPSADVLLEGGYIDAKLEGDEVTAEEEALLARFMPESRGERKSLADIIMEKIAEKEEAEKKAAEEAGEGEAAQQLDPKVVEVYSEVGRYLSRYKQGKVPKVFKVIPSLPNWEELLFLTNPETWTPHATYAATRIFASNFNPAKAQRFFNLVLLPKFRDDIFINKRLNFYLFLALRKSTYKPAAFYKGILLPLAMSSDCTLREAVIMGSVLNKSSIPQLHSAAALIKLAGLRYTGAISVLLRLMVNKKYTLPYMAVDACCEHFFKMLSVKGPLPLIWHRSLLAFCQRYKADLTKEQKESMKELMHVHAHYAITAEIRRELFSVGCRGEPVSAAPAAGAGAGAAALAIPVVALAGAGVTPAAVAGSGSGAAKKKKAAAGKSSGGGMDTEF